MSATPAPGLDGTAGAYFRLPCNRLAGCHTRQRSDRLRRVVHRGAHKGRGAMKTKAAAIALFVLALAVVAGVSGSAGATQTPQEMSVACALKSNGLMRYVSTLNQCKNTEEKVTIKPGPISVCVQPDGTVRKIPPFQCKKPGTALTLPPASGTVYFCAANSNGQLRYVTSPAQCTATEFPVFVTPNDQAPAVAATNGTTPANGA